MSDRVNRLAALLPTQDLYSPVVIPEFDSADDALPEGVRNGKRAAEFLLAQNVYISDESRFTGMMRWNGCPVPGDVFTRHGHRHFKEEWLWPHYNDNIDNLVVFEWQHSAPNYERILKFGIVGCLEQIALSKEKYKGEKDKTDFLTGLEIFVRGVLAWQEKCADAYDQAAKTCTDPTRRIELEKVAENCRYAPKYPARNFYEALHSVLFCFYFLPDSVGTIDRYLYPFYKADLERGVLTREEAKDLISEFFVHLSAFTPYTSVNYSRSAECHFAIGGYLPNGEDGFNDLSRLMVETLLSLDTRRPAISLRWTKKTPFEVLYFMMNAERNDSNKRFAFVSDEPRIAALMKIVHLDFEQACRYTMVGCNEPSFPGTIWLGGEMVNIVRSLTNTLYNRREDCIACQDFDAFLSLYEEELAKDIDESIRYINLSGAIRARDENIVSCFLLDGCIESGVSVTRGGCKTKIAGFSIMGQTCLIDSLSMIRQFVFQEKKTTMEHLLDVLQSNWKKDELLHRQIINTGKFFGNHDPLSDEMGQYLSNVLYRLTKDKRTDFGAPFLIGTLNGYNPHNATFGATTRATPDGRYDGDMFMIGTGQANGKDRKGLLPLLASVAQMDPTGVFCGPIVCNVKVDEAIVKNDEQFEKFVHTVENYFRAGGLHVQLNYVSREELLAARKNPSEYRSLKVRVSGYSVPYVLLPESMQEEILLRTTER